jgi:hypothetical protein
MNNLDKCRAAGGAQKLCGINRLRSDALVYSVKLGLTTQQIADKYSVSLKLATYRRCITGIDAQMRRRRSYHWPLIHVTLYGDVPSFSVII